MTGRACSLQEQTIFGERQVEHWWWVKGREAEAGAVAHRWQGVCFEYFGLVRFASGQMGWTPAEGAYELYV